MKDQVSTALIKMAKFKRPCLVCGNLSFKSHCEIHEIQRKRQHDAKYNTPQRKLKKKLLYGGDYQRRRSEVLANATHCYLCKKPFVATDQVEADHVFPGDPKSPLMPAHRLCNQRKSNKAL